jgi:hypothetical protein
MQSNPAIMSVEEFGRVLDRFDGFSFEELGLNVINEPFVDRTIDQKLRSIANRGVPVGSLFFSSNWLLPKPSRITDFVEGIALCNASPSVGRISLNATVSGIDKYTYDRGQAGATLKGTVAKYRELSFDTAIANVCSVLRQMAGLPLQKPFVFFIKAYSDDFSHQQMGEFWSRTLAEADIPPRFVHRYVRIVLNHLRITFARQELRADRSETDKPRTCASGFLSDKLVIGARGELGLCCQDGLRTIVVGNILSQSLTEIVFSRAYQEHLRIATGAQIPADAHPCKHCEFYSTRSLEQIFAHESDQSEARIVSVRPDPAVGVASIRSGT